MRLSWNEVRARAAAFADEWQDAAYEKGETQSFYNAFFRVFGVQRRSVARYEEHVAKLDNRSGFIDLFWPGVLIVEQKSAGRDLKAAYEQAGEYFDALPERDRPRHILVSDFQTFELHAPPGGLARLSHVRKRIAAVRAYREASKSAPTQKLAETPTLYHVNIVPTAPFLVVPKVSSERREYVPIGWLEPPTIPSDLIFVLRDASLADFALLTSAMHMAWLRHIGGRLESRYRYSIGLVYNTFPLPPADVDPSKLEPLAQAVLDARAAHSDATLADLYHPDLMPPNLRRAHQALDRAVDRLYRRSGFASERERVEHLFMLYERTCTPLGSETKINSAGRSRR